MENIEENKIITVKFRAFRRSSNTNSFGLRGFWFLAQDGTAVEAAGNSLRDLAIGDYLTVSYREKAGVLSGFSANGWEIPTLKTIAPPKVVDIIFNREPKDW